MDYQIIYANLNYVRTLVDDWSHNLLKIEIFDKSILISIMNLHTKVYNLHA